MKWSSHARRLTAQVAESGALTTPWRTAFENTPRHVFVPRFIRFDGTVVDGDDPAQYGEWLTAVYTDEALTTQVRPEPDTGRMIPTSSSSRPSQMAHMLALLNVDSGHTVLDVGTGTGYNAALLSQRLGDEHVTSVDIDPDLVDTARHTLAAVGLAPHLDSADGLHGYRPAAPYDRIIATGSVPAVPRQWIMQLADDGVIVTDLRAPTSTCLIALHANGDGSVTGTFDDTRGYFMWLRPDLADPRREPGEGNYVFDHSGKRTGTATIAPDLVDHPGLGLMISACVPGIVQSMTSLDPYSVILRTADGSWARVEHGTGRVIQVGARSVWDEIELVADRWRDLGRPGPEQFSLTVHRDGHHEYRVAEQPIARSTPGERSTST